jgi:hypothetical protein
VELQRGVAVVAALNGLGQMKVMIGKLHVFLSDSTDMVKLPSRAMAG